MAPFGGPCRRTLALLLYGILSNVAFAQRNDRDDERTCYNPNGTVAYNNAPTWPYLPCQSSRQNTMCCRTNSTDTCTPDGLCKSEYDGNLWRVFCTDPTWESPGCTKLCLNEGTDADGRKGTSVQVTKCLDGSYCCGTGPKANDCCSNGGGVWIDDDGNETNVNPKNTNRRHGAASTSSAQKTNTRSPGATNLPGAGAVTTGGPGATVSQTSSSDDGSSNNTGAIAGGVVGGVLGIALIVIAVLLIMRRRKNKRMTNEKNGHGPYAHQGPKMYGELDASNGRQEMEGSLAQAEMPADGYYNPKAQKPVHEMPT
ncbi:MAG: hypothetical protein Q9174_002307 [Haloplaca sp. 1 TL-2023]